MRRRRDDYYVEREEKKITRGRRKRREEVDADDEMTIMRVTVNKNKSSHMHNNNTLYLETSKSTNHFSLLYFHSHSLLSSELLHLSSFFHTCLFLPHTHTHSLTVVIVCCLVPRLPSLVHITHSTPTNCSTSAYVCVFSFSFLSFVSLRHGLRCHETRKGQSYTTKHYPN